MAAMDMDDDEMGEIMRVDEAWEKVFGTKGVLLVQNFPHGLEFGMNCMVYESGPRFQGVVMIPHGIHFIYYSHINFPRQGFFTVYQPSSRLKIRHWDTESDELVSVKSGPVLMEQQQRLLCGDLNSNVAPYSEEHHHAWQNITQFITEAVLLRANCDLDKTLLAGDVDDETEADKELTRVLLSNKRSSFLSTIGTSERTSTASYCPIRQIEAEVVQSTYNTSAFARKLTQMQLDKSWLIEEMLQRYYPQKHWSALLGELQVSFIMFMMLYSYHSLNHWKLLIGYVCKAEHFLQTNQDFSASFIKVLFNQLKFIPDDFFENEISANSFILPALTSLFSCLNYVACSEDLNEHKRRFERYISKKFNIRVVSTTITTPAVANLQSSADLPMENSGEEATVDDSYCVMEGNERQLQDEETAHIVSSDLPQEGPGEPLTTTPVRLSIPMDHVLSPAEKEELKFSWRYPLICTEMKKSNGREDMIMTAMRLYEEVSEVLMNQGAKAMTKDMEMIRAEAIKFIENEAPLLM